MTEMPRETGAEKAGQSCPSCGGTMQVVESAYGSTSATCPKCTAAAAPRQQAAQTENTLPRVTGTATTKQEAPDA